MFLAVDAKGIGVSKAAFCTVCYFMLFSTFSIHQTARAPFSFDIKWEATTSNGFP